MIPDECCTKTCLNPFLSLHNFFTFFIVLLHIVSTVLQYMNTVYTNVDPACITDCGYQIVVSSPFVQIIIIIIIIIIIRIRMQRRKSTQFSRHFFYQTFSFPSLQDSTGNVGN